MVSGGARMRSGPAADPMSLRQDSSKGKDWVTLPVEPVEVVPDCPLDSVSRVEAELWAELWQKPQAHMWVALGLKFQVALYVRNFIKASGVDSPAAWMSPLLRQESELGLSTVGMAHLGWKFGTDELSERRDERVVFDDDDDDLDRTMKAL